MKKLYSILVLLMAAIAFSYTPLPSQQVQFEEALAMEEVQGNLREAIVLYQKIVADNGGNRALAAKALLRLGGCYEKLGQDEARKTYEQLIGEYPEQQEEVRTAQAKLAAMSADSHQAAGVTIRKLGPFGDDESDILVYSVSADGRYMGASNYATGNAAIVDLVAGKHWDVTDYGPHTEGEPYQQVAEEVFVSPDGKRLVFTHEGGHTFPDIRIVGSDGTAERVLLSSDDIGGWGEPIAWSPDGKYLAVYKEPGGNPGRALVSVDDGEVRAVKTSMVVGELGFSPDGRFLAYSPRTLAGNAQQQTDVYVLPVSGGQEIAIAAHPAQDRFVGWAPNNDILFTSDRTGTFGLYGVAVEDGRQSGEPRLLKESIGDISGLGISDAGSLYYALDRTIRNSFFASIDFSTGRVLSEPEKISDRFDDSTSMPSWSPDGRYLSYLLYRPGHATPTVVIREISSGEERELAPNAVLWPAMCRIRWHADGKSLLALGAKGDDTGLLRISAAAGEVSLVAPVPFNPAITWHATEWSPDAKWLFYLRFSDKEGQSSIIRRNLENGKEQVIYSEEDDGFPRGYRLSPDGKSLVFDQRLAEPNRYALRVVPTNGGDYREVFTGPEIQSRGLSRAWTNDSRHILFVSSLGQIWVVPAEGGEARATEIELRRPGRIMAISFDPNSDRFAFSTRGETREFWAMENFLPESQDAMGVGPQ